MDGRAVDVADAGLDALGWPIARYAAALGVTDDKLHAHCKREKARNPRAIIHERLIQEACTRLHQLDLPVEQIGYGLGFRDPGYYSRFFRKIRAFRPAPIAAASGSSTPSGPLLCGMAIAVSLGSARGRNPFAQVDEGLSM